MSLFGRLIDFADAGAILSCLGWIFFWLDSIPYHLIHFHMVTQAFFALALLCSLYAAWLMLRTANRMGTRQDRVTLALEVLYGVTTSPLGLVVFYLYPPH